MRKGFTLIELIMVIVILGILAAVALPNYFGLVNKANESAEAGVVGGVRAGIATQFAAEIATGAAHLAALDAAAVSTAASTANPFFGNVLSEPITGNWSKNAAGAYVGPNAGVYTFTAGAAGSPGTFR